MDSDLVKGLLPRCIQYHKNHNVEHRMSVGGTELRECKETTTVLDENFNELGIQVLVHTRWIDLRSYTVQEVRVDERVVDHRVNSEMPEEEIGSFQEEWNEKWHPTEDVETIVDNHPEEIKENIGEVVAGTRQHFALPSPSVIPTGHVRNRCKFFEEKKEQSH